MPQVEVNGEWMEECENCGNIWDGNAQCNCWQLPGHYYYVIDVDYDSADSGYDSDTN
jgi:hypothetical protein